MFTNAPRLSHLMRITDTLRQGGFSCYVVGGAVRDVRLWGSPKDATDFDFASNATPKQMLPLFRQQGFTVIPTGLKHGTITVVYQGQSYEITTFRIDGLYSDQRHPDQVQFVASIEEDLARRDFTINAMAFDLHNHQLIDPFSGQEDLREQRIRTVGCARDRFSEDPLRMLRACRFAACLGFHIDQESMDAIRSLATEMRLVSPERVRDEWQKLIRAEKPSIGIEYMRQTRLLDVLMPELLEGFGESQNVFHMHDVYYHNLSSCDAASADLPLVRFAALFHDIGKARAKHFAIKIGNGNVFYNHEIIGARMTHGLLKRMRFSKQERFWITELVRFHMFHYTSEWSDGSVRRFLRKCDEIGAGFVEDLFLLREADRIGSGTKQRSTFILEEFKARIERIRTEDSALKVSDLRISGHDIMHSFALPQGRMVGDTLRYLLEIVLDHPEYNTPEQLLQLAETYIRSTPSMS